MLKLHNLKSTYWQNHFQLPNFSIIRFYHFYTKYYFLYKQHWRIIQSRSQFKYRSTLHVITLRYNQVRNLQNRYYKMTYRMKLKRRKLKKLVHLPVAQRLLPLYTRNRLWNHNYCKPQLLSYYIVKKLRKTYTLKISKFHFSRFAHKSLHTRQFESDFRLFLSCPVTNLLHPHLVYTYKITSLYWNFFYIYHWRLIH